MAREQDAAWKAVRRFLLIGLIIGLVSLFGLWRVENQRLERFRNALTDEILPKTNLLLKPITISYQILSDFKSYTKLYQQNQDLKNELQKIKIPTLIISGDEDDWCLEPSLYLERTIPASGLWIVPKPGHTINLEEPAAFNMQLSGFFVMVESKRWSERPKVEGASALLSGLERDN